MRVVPAIVQEQHQELLALDQRVDEAEGEGLRARWEFGSALLRQRVGGKLPVGLLDELVERTGKHRTEFQVRMQFAELPLLDAIQQYKSWHEFWHRKSESVHFSSDSDEWETPQDLFDELDAEFDFTLDVCASPEKAKCARFFAADGLEQDWTSDVCWMNPPYSGIKDWLAKAYESAQHGATVVCLVPARPGSGWVWDYCRHGEIRLLRGRLRFGESETSAPFDSMVVVFPREPRVVWWERG